LLSIIVSVISQIGDFSASTIKRYCGIKDYGSVLPGHGGILDRFDSMLFISPIIYAYFNYLV
jgi:phosphatidate cytidylyltransferase